MHCRRILGSFVALALSVHVVAASEYSDFRIPSHSWGRLQLGLAGRYSPSFSSNDFNQDRRTDARGYVSGSWLHGYESDRLQHTISLSAGASGINRTDEYDLTVPLQGRHEEEDQQDQGASEVWELSGELRHYPLSIPLGYLARLAGQGSYGQSWISEDRLSQDLFSNTAQVNQANNESWRYDYNVSASFGLPWGRVRDVTGVQRVEYVERRLVRDRVLTGGLQPRTRQRLAELFYAESKFELVHDLPDRHFWADFETILREDPGLRVDRLDAYALYHAGNPLVVARGFGRLAGISAGPVITFVHTNEVVRSDSHYHDRFFQADTLVFENQATSAFRRESDDQDARAGAEVAIEQPLGTRWQLSAYGSATSDLEALDRNLVIFSSLALRFWEGERWYWETLVSQNRRTGSDVPDYVQDWFVSYGTSVSYYLEDHVSVDLGARGSQYQYRRNEYRRSTEFLIGFSYRTGSLTAPGLFGPLRPGS